MDKDTRNAIERATQKARRLLQDDLAAQLEGLPLPDCARLATAFAVAKLSRLGPHLPAPEQVRALAATVELAELA